MQLIKAQQKEISKLKSADDGPSTREKENAKLQQTIKDRDAEIAELEQVKEQTAALIQTLMAGGRKRMNASSPAPTTPKKRTHTTNETSIKGEEGEDEEDVKPTMSRAKKSKTVVELD